MKEERMRILHMVRDQIITADEGAALLAALDRSQETAPASRASDSGQPRWFRMQVIDNDSNRVQANITLPVSLVDFGLKMGATVGGVDIEDLRAAITAARRGRVMSVDNGDEGERVEIFLE